MTNTMMTGLELSLLSRFDTLYTLYSFESSPLLQDSGHFYLFSSSRKGSGQSTWAVKRISSTSGGGQAGVSMSSGYYHALSKDVSIPGESEVLWRHSETRGDAHYLG